VVEPFGSGVQTGLDVAQALAIGELGERHAEELIPAGETPDAVIAAVALDASVEGIVRSEVEELSEEGPALVH
jgi:hypothetical protein